VASPSVGVSNVSGVFVASAAVRAGARADRLSVHADLTGQAYDSEVSAYFLDDSPPPPAAFYYGPSPLRATSDSHGPATARSADSLAPPADSP